MNWRNTKSKEGIRTLLMETGLSQGHFKFTLCFVNRVTECHLQLMYVKRHRINK